MLTIQELRGLSDKELHEELSKAQKKLMELRMKHSLGQLKETHELQGLKQLIARIKTIQTENLIDDAKKFLEEQLASAE